MNEIFDKVTKKISKEEKLAFVSTFITGIIVHLFMLTNKIPNHDDVGQTYDTMHRPKYGRWFLFFPAQISGKLSMPFFTGLLGIIFISLSVAVIIYFFKIKSRICVVTISALMVTFPTIATTLIYMQHMDGYSLCLLMTSIAVCLVTSGRKWCWLVSWILLTLSMGIYQAYLPFAVAILIIWHINKLLIEDEDVKKVFLSGIKCICIIAISVVSYLIVTNLALSYYGIEFAKQGATVDLSLRNLPQLIVTAYKESLGYYLVNLKNVHYAYMQYLYILMLIITIVFSVLLFMKFDKRKSKMKIVLLLALYIILPLAAGLIYVMCEYSSIHMLMVYGFVALVLFPIILVDRIEEKGIAEGMKGKKLISLAQIAVVLTVFIASFSYAVVSNKAYFTLYLTYEQSYAYSNRLMAEIQMQDEYHKEDTIILVGSPDINTKYTERWRYEEEDLKFMTGLTPSLAIMRNFPLYLRYYLCVEQPVTAVTSLEQWKELGMETNIEELNCYPDAGAISCEENMVIVKFSAIE